MRKLWGREPVASELSTRSRDEVRTLLKRAGFAVLSETYFYVPPSTTWRGVGDAVVAAIEQVLGALSIGAAAGYFVTLARKSD